MEKIRVAMVSLGCAKNQVDAESMAGILQKEGYAIALDPAQADVIVVNTCGFIESAKRESVETILNMAAYKESGRCKALIMSGCLSQRYADQMAPDLPEVDAFLGIGHIEEIGACIQSALAGKGGVEVSGSYRFPAGERSVSTGPRYAYLKIADGCDNRCAYCAIPLIRGQFVSRPMEALVAEAESLAAQGFDEIIPIAQDTSRYGLDLYGKPMLRELLQKLCAIPGVRWVRPMYLYPDTLSMELLSYMAGEQKICKYLDLPLQHIDDGMLAAMNRRGDSKLIKSILSYARENGFALRTTLMCGFPGESKEAFQSLLSFMEEFPFDRLGAFAFSPEEDTKAASMENQIAKGVKQMRLSKIMSLQRRISRAQMQKRVGETCLVVLESQLPDGRFSGRSQYEAPEVDGVITVTGENLAIGDYVQVRITAATDYDLMGEKL